MRKMRATRISSLTKEYEELKEKESEANRNRNRT